MRRERTLCPLNLRAAIRVIVDETAPLVSIVVTARNAEATISDLLDDFRTLDWPRDRLEIILVDGASNDRTWDIIRAFAASHDGRVVAAQKAGGISVGRNEGFRGAHGEFVAVTDADMRVPREWVRELLAGMDHPTIGVVGGPNEPTRGDLASRCVATLPTHGPSATQVFLGGLNRYGRDYVSSNDYYAAVTRNILYRRSAFDHAGGFDESLRTTEDAELNLRILRAGYRIRYRRAAVVRHVHRNTLASFARQQFAYAYGTAQANRRHPEMFRWRHRLPTLAAASFLLSVGVAQLVQAAWWLSAAALLGFAAFVLTYTLRAAVARKDAALVLLLPFYFTAWQVSWALGYPAGAWRSRIAR